jgi:hypothetical protein
MELLEVDGRSNLEKKNANLYVDGWFLEHLLKTPYIGPIFDTFYQSSH